MKKPNEQQKPDEKAATGLDCRKAAVALGAVKATSKEARRIMRSDFREFAEKASLAEVYFMRDVFCNRGSCFNGTEDLPIAAAFAMAIDNQSQDYVRIPEKHVAAVRRYVGRLSKGEIFIEPEQSAAVPAPVDVTLPQSSLFDHCVRGSPWAGANRPQNLRYR